MSRARDIANYGDGIDTSSITSGTFANARISQSNVTQHEASIDALASNPTIEFGSNATFPSGMPFEIHQNSYEGSVTLNANNSQQCTITFDQKYASEKWYVSGCFCRRAYTSESDNRNVVMAILNTTTPTAISASTAGFVTSQIWDFARGTSNYRTFYSDVVNAIIAPTWHGNYDVWSYSFGFAPTTQNHSVGTSHTMCISLGNHIATNIEVWGNATSAKGPMNYLQCIRVKA